MIRELINFTLESLDATDLPHISVEWSSRMFKTIAVAYVRRCMIRINVDAWNHMPQEEKEETIVHEVCHIVAWHKYKCTKHGRHWQSCMLRMGYEPKASKSLGPAYAQAVAHKKRNRKEAHCGCGVIEVGPTQYNRLRRGIMAYRCRRCGQLIRL